MYLSLLNVLSDTTLKINSFHKSFFIFDISKNYPPYLNLTKVIAKWKTTHNFFYNLFYQQSLVLVFTSKVLKKESNSFSWSLFNFDYDFFKLVSPYFTIKNIQYGEFTMSLRKMLRTHRVFNSIIIDLPYHYKTVQFLTRSGIYTIGLVPFNINP